jgi:hypothetical protein
MKAGIVPIITGTELSNDMGRLWPIGGWTCQFRGGSPHFCPRYYRGGVRRNR